jgi:hypothetical protein
MVTTKTRWNLHHQELITASIKVQTSGDTVVSHTQEQLCSCGMQTGAIGSLPLCCFSVSNS